MKKTVLNVNIAEFLAEFFMNRTGEFSSHTAYFGTHFMKITAHQNQLMDRMKTAIFIMSMACLKLKKK